jgi:hypothetical protein
VRETVENKLKQGKHTEYTQCNALLTYFKSDRYPLRCLSECNILLSFKQQATLILTHTVNILLNFYNILTVRCALHTLNALSEHLHITRAHTAAAACL